MKILWFTWKDKKNILAGGAEVMNEELARRLVGDGHEVIFVTAGFSGCEKEEVKDNLKIIRLGNKWTVYWRAFLYYKKYLSEWPDFVIDEINTIPFFCKFYTKQKNILVVYQLCREIWFYQMFFPLNIIGYILEPLYLWLLNDKKVITISESTKKDLERFGFKGKNISIISVGIEMEPVNSLETIKKFEKPTILSLGAIRSMKRTDQIIKAFEVGKESIPNLELIIAGDSCGLYGQKMLNLVNNSKYSASIQCLGRVNAAQKSELMQKAHLIIVTSVKEGWGLIVTEANSQGTPAVVYNVDGLRDAVKDDQTGLVCEKNTLVNLAEQIAGILKNHNFYKTLQKNSWEWSKKINFKNSYKQFISNING